MKVLVLSLILLLLFQGCALPRDVGSEQNFIERGDLRATNLGREGLNYYSRGRFQDAELRLRQALYLDPSADNLKLNLAATLQGVGLYAEAHQIFTELKAKYPDDPRIFSAEASLYATERKYPEARRSYEQALTMYLASPTKGIEAAAMARSLANLMFRGGFEEDALCYSEQAVMLKLLADEVAKHGRLLIAMNEYDRAAAYVNAYMNDNDLRADPALNATLAVAAFGQGDLEQSAARATSVLTKENVSPDNLALMRLILKYAEPAARDTEEDDAATDEEAATVLSEETLTLLPPQLVKLYREDLNPPSGSDSQDRSDNSGA